MAFTHVNNEGASDIITAYWRRTGLKVSRSLVNASARTAEVNAVGVVQVFQNYHVALTHVRIKFLINFELEVSLASVKNKQEMSKE